MGGFYFYIAICSFLLGVFIRSFVVVSNVAVPSLLLASLVAAGVWICWHMQKLFVLSLVLFCAALGMLRLEIAEPVAQSPLLLDTAVTVVGEVIRDPETREKNTHAYVKVHAVDGQPADMVVLAYLDRSYGVSYGMEVALTGELQTPEAFETDLGRTFNYPGYLAAQGVSLVMYYPALVARNVPESVGIFGLLFGFKDWFKTAVEAVIPEPEVGLGEGLLLGEKGGLGSQLEQVFRRTGIIHIVVLSGYNVMLVVVFVMTVLSYLLGKRVRIVFGLLAIAAFAILVGLSATVLRASVMAALLLVAQATGQTYAVLRALFLAAFAMVLWNPLLLAFDPGFQLSFVATLGLILLAPKLEAYVSFVPSVIGLRSFLVATIATQLFVLPLLLYQIGEVSVVSVVVNILVLPMVPAAMLLTFLAGMTTLVSNTLALFVGYIAYLSLQYILEVAAWFAGLPFAAYTVPPFSFIWVGVGYLALGIVVWRLYRKPEEIDVLADWTIETEKETGSACCADPDAGSVFFR